MLDKIVQCNHPAITPDWIGPTYGLCRYENELNKCNNSTNQWQCNYGHKETCNTNSSVTKHDVCYTS